MSTIFPGGINIRGTLFFNFTGPGWDCTSKIVTYRAAITVNAANMSTMNPAVPATYPTGYPPTYVNTAKKPSNVNISPAYVNFSPADDLPAVVYSIGEVDMHGPLNICGVFYTPCYMEIEEKSDNQTQYISGSVIMGDGIYLENTANSAVTIVTYDPNTIKNLATTNNVGKSVYMTYWQ